MLFTFQSTCYIIELENKERNDTMSKFEVNDIVKCMCNEGGMEDLLIEGEYYVVEEKLPSPRDLKVRLLGNDIPHNIYCKAVRFDKVEPTQDNKKDIVAILGKNIDSSHPHAELVEQLANEFAPPITDELINQLFRKPHSKSQTIVSHNLLQILALALNNTSEEEVLNNLYPLLPLSEIKLGARYKHIITGKKYYLIQDMNHNYHTEANCYLLVDADTHKTVEPMQEGEYSMQLLIRNMGLQLAE